VPRLSRKAVSAQGHSAPGEISLLGPPSTDEGRLARSLRYFSSSIRASSPSRLREQAGHMTASDFCAALHFLLPGGGHPHTRRHAFPISRPPVCHDVKLPFPPKSVSPHALLCICKLSK
jgi:hypothetical protein